MSKEYYLTRRNEIWYVRFKNQLTNKLTTAKSTGKTDRREAEKIAMTWYVNDSIPSNVRSKKTVSLSTKSLITTLSDVSLTKEEARRIVKILQEQGFISDVIYTSSSAAQSFIQFLQNFWDYDNSEYIREKLESNQSIHRKHCKNQLGCVTRYYIPYFKNRLLGTITLKDMKEFKRMLLDLDVSFSRINSILHAGITALKFAFFNEMIPNNCFDGLMFCSTECEPRQILPLEIATEVFKSWWDNGTCKLANYLAFRTGMRMGEIKALRFCDIKDTYLDVCHSWNPDDGLKETKNNESRKVPIEEPLRQMLLKQVMRNPHEQGVESWVFYGEDPSKPCDSGLWLDHLRKVLKKLNVSNWEDICFHSWRHLFVTTMRGKVPDSELQKITGHKTLQMLNHYSEHQTEQALKEMSEAMFKNFLVASKHQK